MNKMAIENESLFSPTNHKMIWLAGIIAGLIVVYIRIFSPSYSSHFSGYSITSMLVESSVFWIIISRMFTEYRKAAFNAMYVSLGIIVIQYYVNKSLSYQVNYYLEFINFTLAIIPTLLFFYLIQKITGKPLIAALVVAALSTAPVIDSALSYMFPFFFSFSELSAILFTILKAIFLTIAFIFLKVEIIKHALLFPQKEFKDIELNLSQEYSKLQYLVLCVATRIALDVSAFGFIRVIAFGKGYNSANPLNYYTILISWMITVFLLAWLHRKYLIEYLLTYNKVPSFLYWGLIIPFINMIIFPISFFFMNNRIDVEERKGNLKNALSMNQYEHIGYIILLLQGISLVFSIAQGNLPNILAGLFSFISFIYFMKGKTIAFYLISGVNLALLVIMALPSNPIIDIDSDLYVKTPLILITIYLMYGIFYIDKFTSEAAPVCSEDKEIETQES